MSTLERAHVQIGRRSRQFRDLLVTEGLTGISDRVRAAVADWMSPKNMALPVGRADVLAADLSRPFHPFVPDITGDQRIIVNWVTIPPGPGSGGHTTMFRMIRYLEAHGYINRLYFYNIYRGDHRYYESITRNYYGFDGIVRPLDEGMEDAHAVIATSWATAYPVFNSHCTGKRFYFVQDFEPFFYPVGALSLLAENTYRMGFHAITAGPWLARKLNSEYGMATDWFDFGCDTSRYQRLGNARRSGIVFYARPETARRGFELGIMALELFAAHHPEIDLHLYGEKLGKLPFRFIDHGRTSPEKLNSIYNRCFAGLSLSMTNVSLVPHEMLAAGCIPVVNDATHNRIVLNNPFIHYVLPYPQALASELDALVTHHDFDSLSRAGAASVHNATWENAGAQVDTILRQCLQTGSEIGQDTARSAKGG